MNFDCLDASYQLITDLVTPIEKLSKRNPKLNVQLTTASTSVALNVSEGRGRAGKDRRYHWRIASGSAQEVVAILEVSERLGYFNADDTNAARHTLTRLQQMLWRMTH